MTVYRGVPLPESWDRLNEDWREGWRAGVGDLTLHLSRPAQDVQGGHYGGVPLPSLWDTRGVAFQAAWQDGVDAAQSHRGQDTAAAPDLSPADEVNAFALVTEDRTDEARSIVSRMSGRDRAVLSFWLEELRDIISDAETGRRMHR